MVSGTYLRQSRIKSVANGIHLNFTSDWGVTSEGILIVTASSKTGGISEAVPAVRKRIVATSDDQDKEDTGATKPKSV
jgi:hypothetical protein